MVLPAVAFDNIARPLGGGTRHILARRDQPDNVEIRFKNPDHLHRAKHRRCAGHIVLHIHHTGAGLERQSTAIEGDGFSNKRNGVLLLHLRGCVPRR